MTENEDRKVLAKTNQKQEIQKLYKEFCALREKRRNWESLWQECYEYALPQRDGGFSYATNINSVNKLFDATAMDCVDQLASSIFAELTPTWSHWFGLAAGIELKDENVEISKTLSDNTDIMQYHFDRSNFAMEVHQCYLDLVTTGTASLLFEESAIGESSAFHFTAVPLHEIFIGESTSGKPDITFRCSESSFTSLLARFKNVEELAPTLAEKAKENPDFTITLIESVVPRKEGGYNYTAFIAEDGLIASSELLGEALILRQGVFESSPFINFRWQKTPGEVYGRSPVMKALPDIKTANKVVELILKNATIAVTGIWQAEDDGVLNPANIRLVPGSIIPKAVGSKGLTPLEAPGNFNLSEIILSDLRTRINHALLGDTLGQVNTPSMTATEVLERSEQMARILGATYGRLQSELLTPLIVRATSILRRRGEITPLYIDGRMTRLEYASPLAKNQALKDANNTLSWLSYLGSLGVQGLAFANTQNIARYLGKVLGVPAELIKGE